MEKEEVFLKQFADYGNSDIMTLFEEKVTVGGTLQKKRCTRIMAP